MSSASTSIVAGILPGCLTSGNPGNVEKKVVKSDSLWLNDGTIVIRTISADAYTLYKVHKSILSLHSPVFRELFDLPQDAFHSGSEHFEGIPVMDLPDVPDDVNDFLKALYLPMDFFRGIEPLFDDDLCRVPDRASGPLRLATKYEVYSLRQILTYALYKIWPSHYSGRRDMMIRYYNASVYNSVNRGGRVREVYPNPAKSIRLAKDLDMPNILPSAFYDLMCAYEKNTGERIITASELTMDDFHRLHYGRVALQKSIRAFVTNLIDIIIPEMQKSGDACEAPVTGTTPEQWPCRPHLQEWWGHVSKDSDFAADPINWLSMRGFKTPLPPAVCNKCKRSVECAIDRKGSGTWIGLKEFFNLEEEVDPRWGEDPDPSDYI